MKPWREWLGRASPPQRSLTHRVLWALTGAVAVFGTVMVVLAFMAFGRMEDELVNVVVRHETQRLMAEMHQGHARVVEGEFVNVSGTVRAWWVDGSGVPASMPSELRALTPGVHELSPNGQTWHVRVADLSAGRLVVAYDATDNEQRVYDFGLIILVLGIVCVLASYALARKIAERVVAPLRAVTDRLALWAPGSMDARLESADESSRLIEAFNRVQHQVDRMMATEREFNANLSHEVRTPLAAIRTDAELMALTSDLPASHQDRLKRVVLNVDAVVTALESARAMTANRPLDITEVDLRQVLDNVWYGLAPGARASGLTLENRISPQARAQLDAHALMTVLRNLIRNAIEHAAPAHVSVVLRPGALIISDDGPGIAPADLPFVFDRYFSHRRRDLTSMPHASREAGDRGLGLAIAKRVCDLQGWSLTVQSPPPGGTDRSGVSFTLAFNVPTFDA